MVAVGVALLPRIGWLVSALLLIAWLASPEADREGTALLLAFVLFPVPLLLPRAGTLWSVPILAPLLGAASLAPAFVAVAALAPTMARRAGLAAAGFLWLAAGEAITGDPLLFGSPDGTESLALWQSSITAGASDAVWPLISSPALAPGAGLGRVRRGFASAGSGTLYGPGRGCGNRLGGRPRGRPCRPRGPDGLQRGADRRPRCRPGHPSGGRGGGCGSHGPGPAAGLRRWRGRTTLRPLR